MLMSPIDRPVRRSVACVCVCEGERERRRTARRDRWASACATATHCSCPFKCNVINYSNIYEKLPERQANKKQKIIIKTSMKRRHSWCCRIARMKQTEQHADAVGNGMSGMNS